MDGTAIKLPLIWLSGNEPSPRTPAHARMYLCLLVPAAENSSTGRLSTVPQRKVTVDVHLIVTDICNAVLGSY